MARGAHNVSSSEKQHLFGELLSIGNRFHHDAKDLTTNQNTFDTWHESQIQLLTQKPFSWTDGSKGKREKLTLGLAQKYLNLMLKDWWGTGVYGSLDYSVLHVSFDGVVWDVLWKLHLASIAQA